MRIGIYAAILISMIGVGACRTIEPPVLEMHRSALAHLGGEQAICDALMPAMARRDRQALVATLERLPRTPGIDRNTAVLADEMIMLRDLLQVSTDILDIRRIGYGVIERMSVYYYEVTFLRLNEPFISIFDCNVAFEEGRGGDLNIRVGTAEPKNPADLSTKARDT
jgi:hypothetical protein